MKPKYPSVGEWLNTLWSIPSMEYYSTGKRNRLLMKPKGIKVSETQSQKTLFVRYSWNDTIVKMESEQGWGDGKGSMPTEGRREPDGNGAALPWSRLHRSTCVIKSELHAWEHVEIWENLRAPCGWPMSVPIVTLDYRRQDEATAGTGWRVYGTSLFIFLWLTVNL